MAINLNGPARKAAGNLAKAFTSDDETQIAQAFVDFQTTTIDSVREEYEAAIKSNDRNILIQRGFRQLTSDETEYYEGVIERALNKQAPRQEADGFIHIGNGEGNANMPTKMMPETIINDVFDNLTENHPILAKVKLTNVNYLTTWLRNKHTRQLAAWGEVESAISEEIKSAFEVVTVTQGKLSAFVLVTIDMLRLGPTFLDGYIRTVLTEAIACGLEDGIVNGTGIGGQPIGLIKNPDGAIDQVTGYPDKTKDVVTSFEPAEYGALVAKLAKDAKGHVKPSIADLTLACNLTDYLTKVMPATTVLTTDGRYVNNLLPIATDVITSEVIADGEAILFLPSEYDLLVGGVRGIEYSDEYKFLEDQRVLKSVMYAYGLPTDRTTALYLDISGLEPGYVNVKVKGTVKTKEQA
jgi:HK97 family phage major capsid protein